MHEGGKEAFNNACYGEGDRLILLSNDERS